MDRHRLVLFSAVLIGFMLLAPRSWAESNARIVRLSYQHGKVEIDRNTGQGFENAIENMPIVEGSKLRTGADGQAEVELEDGTVARLAPDSEFEFPRLALDSGNRLTTIAVNNGTAYFNIRHKAHDVIALALPGQQIEFDNSAHLRVSIGSDQVRLSVFSGEVKIDHKGQEITVKKKETVALDIDDSQYHLAKGIDSMVDDSWDRERSGYQQAYASNTGFSTGPLSPYYGWSDLNYYGGWYSLPGYGLMWQPYNMYAGWSPYGSGAWAWYPGPGWMWVSSYPWGWLPYRYGTWLFVPGWGWAWQPGNVWNTWYAVPRIVNPPLGFVALVPPYAVNGTRPATTVIVRRDPAIQTTPNRMSTLPRGARVISTPGILNPIAPSPNRGLSHGPGVRHVPPSHMGPVPHTGPGAPEGRGEEVRGNGFMAPIGSGFSHIGSGMSAVAHFGGGSHSAGASGTGH